jgi:hypothetical protein
VATTGVSFVEIVSAENGLLFGTEVVATPFVAAYNPVQALDAINATPDNLAISAQNAVPLDKVVFDLSLTFNPPLVGTTFPTYGKYVGAFAKNGCALIVLTGTTAVTIDLTNLGAFAGVTSQAGDTSLATVNCVIFNNVGTTAVTIAPGASNPAPFPAFTGTSPTLSVPAGGVVAMYWPVGGTVTSSAKTITVTPTSGGTLAFAYGGA